MVTLAFSSTSNTNFGPCNNSNNHLQDVSFSSYFNKNEETSIQRSSESSRSLNGLNIVNPPEEHQHSGAVSTATTKKEPEDSEIGVFGAEKYFNEEIDSDRSTKLVSQTNPEIYRCVKDERVAVTSGDNTKSAGTRSVRSESSWNSQNALLQNAARNSNYDSSFRGMEKKTNMKSFLAKLRCKCSCSDENSVDVENSSSIKKSTNSDFLAQENASRKLNLTTKIDGLSKENPFTFPTTNSALESANLNSKTALSEKEQEIQRKSLGVFGSQVLEKRNKSLSIEEKLKILPWDLNSRIREDGFSTNYEDSGSDASSDLFEIESLTGKAKSFLARQGSDNGSPTAYAPSEASIAWSVVTASAADFSVMSECATSPVRNNGSTKHHSPNIKSNKERERRQSSGNLLLGCNSQKAVRVSSDFQRSNTNQNINHVTRFQAEARPAGFEARNRIASRSISRSSSNLYTFSNVAS